MAKDMKAVGVKVDIQSTLSEKETKVLRWFINKHLEQAVSRFQEGLDLGFIDMMADHLDASAEDCKKCDGHNECPFSKVRDIEEEEKPILVEAGLVIDGAKA